MADPSETEVPWVNRPEATLEWEADGVHGVLKFRSPENSELCRIGVTSGPSKGPDAHVPEGNPQYPGWLWHIDTRDDGLEVKVSPSIWYRGHFHSPNPVHFLLVDSLEEAQ